MTRATRAEATAATLKAAILRGDYVSGERLVELTLAKLLSVSQNTVRDALRILEQESWVVKHARRGVYVRKFTVDEAAEIFVLLGAVETLVVGWVFQALTRTALAELREMVVAARAHAYAGEWQLAVERLFQFHERLAQVAGKPLTHHVLQQLYNQARLLEAVRQARAPRNPHELNALVQRHESLFYSLEADDEAGAQRLVQELLQGCSESVLAALAAIE
jgi:DNA-binding GntR family transcriptional regulator